MIIWEFRQGDLRISLDRFENFVKDNLLLYNDLKNNVYMDNLN